MSTTSMTSVKHTAIRIVPAMMTGLIFEVNAIHDQTADAGDGEHLLCHHGAADQGTQTQATCVTTGSSDVFQNVLPDHGALRHALGAGRADVVLTDSLQHGGFGEAEILRAGGSEMASAGMI